MLSSSGVTREDFTSSCSISSIGSTASIFSSGAGSAFTRVGIYSGRISLSFSSSSIHSFAVSIEATALETASFTALKLSESVASLSLRRFFIESARTLSSSAFLLLDSLSSAVSSSAFFIS